MTAAATANAATAPRREDRPVLAAAPLRPGFDRRDLSRYNDPSWDLGPAVFRENARRCHVTAHFGSIDDPAIAAVMRAYLYARLNIDLPGHRPRLPPAYADGEVRVFTDRSGATFGVGIWKMRQLAAARGADYANGRKVDKGTGASTHLTVDHLAQPGEGRRAGTAGITQGCHPAGRQKRSVSPAMS